MKTLLPVDENTHFCAFTLGRMKPETRADEGSERCCCCWRVAAAAQGVGVRNLGLPRDKLLLIRTIKSIAGFWIILPKLFINQIHHTNRDPTLASLAWKSKYGRVACRLPTTLFWDIPPPSLCYEGSRSWNFKDVRKFWTRVFFWGEGWYNQLFFALPGSVGLFFLILRTCWFFWLIGL